MPKSVPYLPNETEELLLKAALLDGDRALASWNAWRKRVNVADLDYASHRLLPLLLDNLQRLGIRHRDLKLYQGVARHVWLDNQLRAKKAIAVLELFARAGIPAMPLKGLALAPLYYANFRLRAMSDIDILVPVDAAGAAARVLREQGWRSDLEDLVVRRDYLATRHAALFVNPDAVDIDLHWHISHDYCRLDADDAFWRHAQPLSFQGFETTTLSDTDHLFHTCIHGGRPSEVSPIRWVADGAQILKRGRIDWHRLIDQTRAFDLVLRLQRTIGYLADGLAMPVPPEALAELRAIAPSGVERFEERAAFSGAHEFLKSVARRYVHYQRNMARRADDEGFIRYLEKSFGAHSLGGVFLWVLRRAQKGWA